MNEFAPFYAYSFLLRGDPILHGAFLTLRSVPELYCEISARIRFLLGSKQLSFVKLAGKHESLLIHYNVRLLRTWLNIFERTDFVFVLGGTVKVTCTP